MGSVDGIRALESVLTNKQSGILLLCGALRECSGLVLAAKSGGFVAGVVPPVGMHEDGVDLFEVDGFGAIPEGFDEAADAEVFNGTQGAFGDAEDESGDILGEGAVRESGAVEQGGVGDAVSEVGVVTKLEGGDFTRK